MLNLNWYFEGPLDFELKQYELLSYLRLVEDCFILKKLSPHLLHLEKVKYELINFKESYDNLYNDLVKNKYLYFKDDSLDGIDNEELYIVYDIVDFSIPQVESKIRLGYSILEKHKQILF
tara:strand:+ start:7123 stop:7482 length:360 start_codon:yes stop_codon:yes gene_type:complete